MSYIQLIQLICCKRKRWEIGKKVEITFSWCLLNSLENLSPLNLRISELYKNFSTRTTHSITAAHIVGCRDDTHNQKKYCKLPCNRVATITVTGAKPLPLNQFFSGVSEVSSELALGRYKITVSQSQLVRVSVRVRGVSDANSTNSRLRVLRFHLI